MARSSIELLRARTKKLGGKLPSYKPECVLYVMSRDQRVEDNHALLAAQAHANKAQLPLLVACIIYQPTENYAREHYRFMFDGIEEVRRRLKSYNIYFYQQMATTSVLSAYKQLIDAVLPAALYFDLSPLRGPLSLHKKLANQNILPVYEVDTHNIVPIWELSSKQEFGAYTLRPKLHKAIAEWLVEPGSVQKQSSMFVPKNTPPLFLASVVLSSTIANRTKNDFKAGEHAAHEQLNHFLTKSLPHYAIEHNDATKDSQSNLSPYLHFGHISSLRVALTLRHYLQKSEGSDISIISSPKLPQAEGKSQLLAGIDALLEEMIVRKELSDNFCFYNDNYDNLEGAPHWAQASLDEHRLDIRTHVYSFEQFEAASTHDEIWNAAQTQLTKTGKIHGYMRMYWAKKVLEWTASPEVAIKYLIKLNDFYSLDGRDPNGYVGILWSVAGLHDRSWFERPVYGKIRYMNHTGIAKRFDVATYTSRYVAN
jgi:deoxyribodipyrimidine photo-lyase